MNTAKEIRAKNVENSKNIIKNIDISDAMTVRLYSKSRTRGEVKFKKKRDTLNFKSTDDANDAINKLVDAGVKIRKVEIISQDHSILAVFKPERIRLTPTQDDKLAKREEREQAKAEKARLKEIELSEKKQARELKKQLKSAANSYKSKAAKNIAAEALA